MRRRVGVFFSFYVRYVPGGRDELKEAIIVCDDGVVCCTRVANQLLALKATHATPLGMLRKKIQALVEHLERPLTVVSQHS